MSTKTTEQRFAALDDAIAKTAIRPAAGPLAGRHALEGAIRLVSLVREEGPDGLGEFLDRRTRDGLYGLVVALAAMVPDDQTPEDLLAWLVPDPSASGRTMTPEAQARHAARRRAARAAS